MLNDWFGLDSKINISQGTITRLFSLLPTIKSDTKIKSRQVQILGVGCTSSIWSIWLIVITLCWFPISPPNWALTAPYSNDLRLSHHFIQLSIWLYDQCIRMIQYYSLTVNPLLFVWIKISKLFFEPFLYLCLELISRPYSINFSLKYIITPYNLHIICILWYLRGQ